MGQAHSFHDVEDSIVTPSAGVPMLNWPDDLFSDEATAGELVTVDFLLQCDPAFLPHTHPTPMPECYAQLAA